MEEPEPLHYQSWLGNKQTRRLALQQTGSLSFYPYGRRLIWKRLSCLIWFKYSCRGCVCLSVIILCRFSISPLAVLVSDLDFCKYLDLFISYRQFFFFFLNGKNHAVTFIFSYIKSPY